MTFQSARRHSACSSAAIFFLFRCRDISVIIIFYTEIHREAQKAARICKQVMQAAGMGLVFGSAFCRRFTAEGAVFERLAFGKGGIYEYFGNQKSEKVLRQ